MNEFWFEQWYTIGQDYKHLKNLPLGWANNWKTYGG